MSYKSKSYRKFMASITTAAVVASMVAPVASAEQTKSFTDVKEGSWAADAIYSLTEQGIVVGYGDNTYRPNESIYRGHVANLITKAVDLPVPSDLKAFDDISSNSAYAEGAAATKAAGIFVGYQNKFDAEGALTREQMASVIVRAFNLKTVVNGADVSFTDWDSISSYHQDDVKILAQNGITVGNEKGEFDPKAPVTRGAFAVFLTKALETLNDNTFELSLMHTNDTHANLDKVAKRTTAIKEVRAKKPNALLVDAGDVLTGTLYFNEFLGQADLEFMNLVGYDVMTFGNHEFDLGSSTEGHQALADFVQKANFPFVSANVDFSRDELFNNMNKSGYTDAPEDGSIYSGIIKEVEGEKIGFFGLTTAETKDISSPEKIEFNDYLVQAEKAVTAFENAGVDKIVALTHIGYDDNPAIDNDQELAKLVDGIDIIVGGHTHTQLDEPVLINEDENGAVKDPTIVVQAYQYNDFLGTVDVEFDENGVIVGYAGELIKISDKEEDTATAKALKGYADQVAEVKFSETGAVAVKELTNPRGTISVRNSETELGNLITDGMLDKAKELNPDTVIAIQNGGGIRASIDQGPITLGDIITTLPFGNTLATMKLTGAEIIEVLEHGLKEAPNESGGFLQVSGMKLTYNSSEPVGERVVSVEVNIDGEYTALDTAKEYVVATNAFTAKGGDAFDMLAEAYKAGKVTDLGLADWENLRDYVIKLKDVEPTIEGRIKDIATANE